MTKIRPVDYIIFAAYIVFTIVVIRATLARPLISNVNMPYEGILTVTLDDRPIHQVFTARRLAGVKLSLKNPSGAQHGEVLVIIGNEKTGEIYKQDIISVVDIPNTNRRSTISVAFPGDLIKLNNSESVNSKIDYYLELSTSGIDDGYVKTYAYKSDQGYILDGATCEYAIYFAPMESGVPGMLVTWIIVTPILILLAFECFKGNSLFDTPKQEISYLPKRNKVAWAIILIVIVLVGNGWVNRHMFEKGEKEIPVESDALSTGVYLEPFTQFHQDFTVTTTIDKIYLHFDEYPVNLGSFTTWISDDEGNVLLQADKEDLFLSTGIYYALNVTEANLQKGKAYTINLATSEINPDEEIPVLKGIGLVK